MIPTEKLRELAEGGEKVEATYIVGKVLPSGGSEIIQAGCKLKFPNATKNAEVAKSNAEYIRKRAEDFKEDPLIQGIVGREADRWEESADVWEKLSKETEC